MMKKEYVKPIMESEAFVANEYVAACWSVKCTVPYCDSWRTPYKVGGPYDSIDECATAYTEKSDPWFYKLESDPDNYYHKGGTIIKVDHKVKIEGQVGNGTTSNAS